MSFSFGTTRIRLQSDARVPNTLIDRVTERPIQIPKANVCTIQIGIFANLLGAAPSSADQVVDVVGDEWESLTLTVQKTPGDNLISETVGAFTALTYANWNADAGQHCTIELTDGQTNITPGVYRLSLTVYTTTGGPFPVGVGDVEIYDPYNLNSSTPADENPGAPISQDAADLRYAPIGGGSGGLDTSNVIYMDPNGGTGSGADGTSALPFSLLTEAWAAAEALATALSVPAMIQAAPGEYNVTGDINATVSDVYLSCPMPGAARFYFDSSYKITRSAANIRLANVALIRNSTNTGWLLTDAVTNSATYLEGLETQDVYVENTNYGGKCIGTIVGKNFNLRCSGYKLIDYGYGVKFFEPHFQVIRSTTYTDDSYCIRHLQSRYSAYSDPARDYQSLISGGFLSNTNPFGYVFWGLGESTLGRYSSGTTIRAGIDYFTDCGGVRSVAGVDSGATYGSAIEPQTSFATELAGGLKIQGPTLSGIIGDQGGFAIRGCFWSSSSSIYADRIGSWTFAAEATGWDAILTGGTDVEKFDFCGGLEIAGSHFVTENISNWGLLSSNSVLTGCTIQNNAVEQLQGLAHCCHGCTGNEASNYDSLQLGVFGAESLRPLSLRCGRTPNSGGYVGTYSGGVGGPTTTSDFLPNVATYECWFRADNDRLADGTYPGGARPSSSSREFYLFEASGTNSFLVTMVRTGGVDTLYIGGLGISIYYGVTTLRDAAWHHIAITSDGTNMRVFIDGVSTYTGTGTWAFGSGALNIGNASADKAWLGDIMDFRISDIIRYPGSTTFTPPVALQPDGNTRILLSRHSAQQFGWRDVMGKHNVILPVPSVGGIQNVAYTAYWGFYGESYITPARSF